MISRKTGVKTLVSLPVLALLALARRRGQPLAPLVLVAEHHRELARAAIATRA